jgi:hypothetical protein
MIGLLIPIVPKLGTELYPVPSDNPWNGLFILLIPSVPVQKQLTDRLLAIDLPAVASGTQDRQQ